MRLDPVYVNARRETAVIIVICLALAAWSLGIASALGIGPLDPEQAVSSAVGGFPIWVIWSLFVPWIVGTLITGWFCFFFLADDPLESPDDVKPEPLHSEGEA